jgi:hypothetical protein
MMLIAIRTEKLADVGLASWSEPLMVAVEQVAFLALPSLAPTPLSVRFGALWACCGPAADRRLSDAFNKTRTVVNTTPRSTPSKS